MFPIISNAPGAQSLFVGLGVDWSTRGAAQGDMGDGERRGGGEHRIEELKATLPVHLEMWPWLIIFCFNMLQEHANGLGPSHSCHTAGSQRGHKGRKWFQTGKWDPRKLGSGCTHTPSPPTPLPSAHALQLLGTDSGSLRDARIISCLTLISTRGENRHSRALKCTKTHT